MKLKKLLAGVTAAALAVGLVAVTPLVTSAADEKVLFTGSKHMLKYDGNATAEWNNENTVLDSDMLISGSDLDDYENLTITFQFDSDEISDLYYTYTDDEGKQASYQWKAQQLLNVVIKTNDKYPVKAWAWLETENASVDAYANEYTADTDITTSVTTASIKEALAEVEQFDYLTMTNAVVLKTGWVKGLTVTKVALTDPADDTVYVSKTYSPDRVGDSEGDKYFDGTWDLSKAVGPNARVEFTFKDDDASGGFAVCDGNAAEWWTEKRLTGNNGKKSFKVSEFSEAGFTSPMKIVVQAWNGSVPTGMIVYNGNDDDIYTPYSEIPVTGITVTGAPTEAMEIGDTVTLTATVEPENATELGVTWSSSNEKVATVEDGVVTAVGAGTATVTAASVSDPTIKDTAKITVAAPIVEVTPAINVTSVTVNKETLADQKDEIAGKVEVTIEGLKEGTDFTTAVTMDKAAGEADSKATVTVTLTAAGAAKYKIAEGKGTFEVAVTFVNLDDSEYQGYTADTTVDIDAAQGDTDDDVKAAVRAAIEAKTITLKGVDTDDQTGKIGTVKSDMVLSSIKAESGKYTVSVDVDVYKIIRQGKDLYYPEGVTLGDSTKASSKITLTFTVNVTAPEKSDEPSDKPSDDPSDKPSDDPSDKPSDEPSDKPSDEPSDKPSDEPSDKPSDEPSGKPSDEPSDTPSTPETPAPVPTTVNNRVGDGGSVSTDINTGAAFTGTRAMEEVSRAKPGDSINIVMTGSMNEGEIIAKIAYKKDVTVNLKYSAYTVSINSDDVSDDFEAKGFYSTARFLSAKEKAAFAGAKELRQINVRNLDGIEKATITVTMRGGSKGMDATALNRLSAGKYKTVGTGKVAEDRTFSFEITKAGNYVVYTGKVNMGE